ncbi:MAG: helix-hairpin-helix domain-containing protein [Acidobacteriota bacterium]|nr:helix-hairpin-helix domain-containing protein [Acidobacteriota bacterium]MDE2963798.1 helix-hairpin-helix domain-containing protein [Acidobacteriota bacterium]
MRKHTLTIFCSTLLLALASIAGPAQAKPIESQADTPGKNGAGEMPSKAVDINTATEKQLSSLPGIGPQMAKRIIEARPFKSIQELKRVKGIGDKKFERLKSHVVCEAKASQ